MSEPRDDNGFSIYRITPDGKDQLAQNLTALEAMAFLSFGTGTDVETQQKYLVVRQFDGKHFVADEFLRAMQPQTMAAQVVVQTWREGRSGGALGGGQILLRRHWPTMAAALEALEAEINEEQS